MHVTLILCMQKGTQSYGPFDLRMIECAEIKDNKYSQQKTKSSKIYIYDAANSNLKCYKMANNI